MARRGSTRSVRAGLQTGLSCVVLLAALPAVRGQGGCSVVGDAMFSNSCPAFVEYVQASRNYYYSRPNSELQAYVNQTPAPSAQCCADATDFISRSCSCNQFFIAMATAPRGFDAQTMAVVARAIQLSACEASASIVNPCDTRGILPAPQTQGPLGARTTASAYGSGAGLVGSYGVLGG